jgi:superfamily I DNA/RNA helicase
LSKVYEGRAFSISEQVQEQAQRLLFTTKSGRRSGPTPQQLQVIFSDVAASSVLAGAGSGKSTTLVSRLLFLHKFLGVPLENLAVFTFTRKSRQDFIRRLVQEAARWGVTQLTTARAERVVRTFHSKALQVSRELLQGGETLFEFLGDKQREPGQSDGATDGSAENKLLQLEAKANSIEGFVELEPSDEQTELLKSVYAACYAQDEQFRAAILELFRFTVASEKWEQNERFNQKLAYVNGMQRKESALCDHLEAQWRMIGSWPLDGVQARDEAGKRFALPVHGVELSANGFCPTLGVYVVLGEYPELENRDLHLDGKRINPFWAIKDRRLVLLVGCGKPIRYLRSPRDVERFLSEVKLASSPDALSAPMVELRLPGETTAKPVFACIHALALFAENLGLAPERLHNELGQAGLSSIEMHAVYATSAFFKEFQGQLASRGLVTFNQLFFRLGMGSGDLARIGIGGLMGVKHLMIDEFQDISPLIVRFVTGLQSELWVRSNGQQKPSVMAVGDDWQSIYGWRGSAPHFLLNFNRYFEGATALPVLLEQNFRSSQNIIDCGDAFIAQVRAKSTKKGVAANPVVKNLPLKVLAVEEFEERDVVRAIEAILSVLGEDEEVYLLAAKNDDLVPYRRRIRDDRLMSTTFHQSKGLEAEFVVLLGAPRHFGSHNIKNALYRRAGRAVFPQTFDEGQRDEAFRVAYVAATRAKRLCLWFAEPRGTVMEMVPPDGLCRVKATPDVVFQQLSKMRPSGQQGAAGKAVAQS